MGTALRRPKRPYGRLKGADAIKLQTYTADTLTLNCDKEDFVVKGGTLWDNKTLYELYQDAYTPWEVA